MSEISAKQNRSPPHKQIRKAPVSADQNNGIGLIGRCANKGCGGYIAARAPNKPWGPAGEFGLPGGTSDGAGAAGSNRDDLLSPDKVPAGEAGQLPLPVAPEVSGKMGGKVVHNGIGLSPKKPSGLPGSGAGTGKFGLRGATPPSADAVQFPKR